MDLKRTYALVVGYRCFWRLKSKSEMGYADTHALLDTRGDRALYFLVTFWSFLKFGVFFFFPFSFISFFVKFVTLGSLDFFF